MNADKITPAVQPDEPAKRPYAAPALVTHGDVQALTHGPKIGETPDQDGGGSFIPDGTSNSGQ